MAVISGVLKGPMGDPRVGVVIELRAVQTSATVVIQARSQSVTDATGRYTLSVEPGQYDVMITAAGRQPERVGGIQVMVNSSTGTLNNFLTIPGETDLNPAIVATVDQMRAETAASAAAAKVSETNVVSVASTINRPSLTEPVKKTYLTIIDDDTRVETYTFWKRLADELGIKITLSVVPNWINGNYPAGKPAMTLSQLREMYDAGHDLASHGYDTITIQDHLDDPEKVTMQLNGARQWLIDNGFVRDQCYDNFVWPQGLSGDDLTQRRAKAEVRKYYKCAVNAFTSLTSIYPGVFDSYNIPRPSSDGQTPEKLIGWLDVAITSNNWMILLSHAWHSTDLDGGSYEKWSARYRALINYAREKNVEIVTLSQGLKIRGNATSVGEWIDSPNCLYVNNDGSTYPKMPTAAENGVGGTAPILPSLNTLEEVRKRKTGQYCVLNNSADMPSLTPTYVLDWTITATTNNGYGILVAKAMSTAGSSDDRVFRNTLQAGQWRGWRMMHDASSLPSPLNAGSFGLGGTTPIQISDPTATNANQLFRIPPNTTNAPTTGTWAGVQGGYNDASRWTLALAQGGATVDLRAQVRSSSGVVSGWSTFWHSTNTTVDANGFIKKASPIVKLFGTGESELNDQSQGVATERVSEGVYRISGTLGFNADAEWGGVDGGIEIPTDRNKLPLVWVDYEVDETGDLLIKTFHRVNATAPKFAQNVKVGYKEGQPIDIPAGRWIDLRVEMPGGDEPVPENEEVPEVTPEVTELEGGEEQAPGEVSAPIEEPKE